MFIPKYSMHIVISEINIKVMTIECITNEIIEGKMKQLKILTQKKKRKERKSNIEKVEQIKNK